MAELELADVLNAIHDPGGEALLGGRGTVVFTEEIGADPKDASGRDYREWRRMGLSVVVRLNFSHTGHGTIPPSYQYGDFARRVANYIRASKGCIHWVIGNEPNYAVERPELPDGSREVITPTMYADCFSRCARLVYSEVSDQHHLWVAAVAPWNINTTYPGNQAGDWIKYFVDVLTLTKGFARGIALHTYTHGTNPELIWSTEKMRDAPYQDRHYHFLAFEDFMHAIPAWGRELLVGITETDQNDAWADVDSGWVVNAYAEIGAWNVDMNHQPIQFVALFRWPKELDGGKWGIEHRPQLQADIAQAFAHNYPARLPKSPGWVLSLPDIDTGKPAEPQAPPATWPEYPEDFDPRLIERGVNIVRAAAQPGQLVWRVTRGRWFNKEEARGLTHAFLNAFGENGERFPGARGLQWWAGVPNGTPISTPLDKPPGEPMGNFTMGGSRNDFSYWIDAGGYASDVVEGVGIGEATPDGGYNKNIHTASEFDWTLVREPQRNPTPAPVVPVPTPTKPPAVDLPKPIGGKDRRFDPFILEAILEVESGSSGYNENGSLKARIEAHILKRYLAPAVYAAHFRYDAANPLLAYYREHEGDPWIEYHSLGQPGEWEAIRVAALLDGTAALKSTSWGAPQIMGFNHEAIGYGTVEAMVKAFNRSEAVQLIGCFNFILYTPGLFEAMQVGDFGAVARLYNGNEAVYKPLLEAAYKRVRAGG